MSEEQGEHSRKRTECTRSGAKKEHCISEELRSVPRGWDEPGVKREHCTLGELGSNAASLGSEGRGAGESELGEDSQIVVSVQQFLQKLPKDAARRKCSTSLSRLMELVQSLLTQHSSCRAVGAT